MGPENNNNLLEAILGTVEKPGRYCGGERNAVEKDLSKVPVKIALAFPDLYEIGMSHLGLKIIYHILNDRELTAAERVFLPQRDLSDALRSQGMQLFSLENRLPLSEFDVVGFSLQHELCYTNVLEMLDLGGIPIKAEERTEGVPIVIGGGPCAFNPEPMWEFFDLFVIGDGEAATTQLAEILEDGKRRGLSRKELIDRARELEGVYVPTDYEMEYSDGGVARITYRGKLHENPFDAPRTKRAPAVDLETAQYPEAFVLPNISVVHDRGVVEIMRGCSRGCRFCQAGYICRPMRARSLVNVEDLAEKVIANTGYEEVSFLSLSSGDYPEIERLIGGFVSRFADRRVSVALPSLRVETMTQSIVNSIKSIKRTGFTLAPEAATERLRSIINKPTTDEAILESVERAFAAGWRRVKLYFMIGLPHETDRDIEALVELIHRVSKAAGHKRGAGKLSVSLSTFVPKPHTPFQWSRQASLEEVLEKHSAIRRSIRSRATELKWHNPRMSVLEGVLSRGDRRLSKVIEHAWRSGCLLDNWTEEFDYDKWMAAFGHCDIDPLIYTKARDASNFLPWEHIDSGVSRDFLIKENEAAEAASLTPDCRASRECQGCGACSDSAAYLSDIGRMTPSGQPKAAAQPPQSRPASPPRRYPSANQMVFPIRCKYERVGPARFISHLDVLTVLARAARQSGLPLEYTKGFNPQPRLSAGLPLPMGCASIAEYVDFRFTRPVSPDKLIESLNPHFMQGLQVLSGTHLYQKTLSLCSLVSEVDYWIVVDLERLASLSDAPDMAVLSDEAFHRDRVSQFLAESSIKVSKVTPKRTTELDLRAFVSAMDLMKLAEGRAYLNVTLKVDETGRTARPTMVLSELYGTKDKILYFADITRYEQYCWRRGKRRNLLESESRSESQTQRIRIPRAEQ